MFMANARWKMANWWLTGQRSQRSLGLFLQRRIGNRRSIIPNFKNVPTNQNCTCSHGLSPDFLACGGLQRTRVVLEQEFFSANLILGKETSLHRGSERANSFERINGPRLVDSHHFNFLDDDAVSEEAEAFTLKWLPINRKRNVEYMVGYHAIFRRRLLWRTGCPECLGGCGDYQTNAQVEWT